MNGWGVQEAAGKMGVSTSIAKSIIGGRFDSVGLTSLITCLEAVDLDIQIIITKR